VALADQVAEAARDLAEEMESLEAAAEPEQVLAAVEEAFREEIFGIRVPDRVLALRQHRVLAAGSTLRERV
jgi:hypothetical protein